MAVIELTLPSPVRRTAAGAVHRPPMPVVDLLAVGIAVVPLGRPSAFLVMAAVLATVAAAGGYKPRLTATVGGWLRPALPAVGAAAAASAVAGGSPVTSVAAAGLALAGLLAARVTAVAARRHAPERAIVVGAGEVGSRVAAAVEANRQLGLEVVGFVDDVAPEGSSLPLLGTVDELEEVARDAGADHVVVAYGPTADTELVAALRRASALDAEVWALPRFFDLGIARPARDAEEIWGYPFVRIERRAGRSAAWLVKRAIDVAASLTGILLLAPVLASLAVLVKATSPGPVLYRQRRIGQDGRSFDVLKFRSLQVNDDGGTTWNVTTDDRVTRVGRIMRPTSLDELPQLFNVLKGDMTLVGPRPERAHFVELFSETVPGYAIRDRVPAGLTGLAQVNGLRGDTSIEDRARFDNRYIDTWTLLGDLAILLRTVKTVVRPPASVRIQAPARAEVVAATDEPALSVA